MARVFLAMVLGVGALVGFGSGFASLAHGGWDRGGWDHGCPHARGDGDRGWRGDERRDGDPRGDREGRADGDGAGAEAPAR